MILQRKKEIEALLSQSSDQLSRINQYILEKKEGVMLQYQAVIKDLPECIVYSKRMRIPVMIPIFKSSRKSERKWQLPIRESNVPFLHTVLNIYHDKEYKEKDIDVEYCEAVNQFGKNEDGIIFKKIPSVKAVSTLHKGPYKNLGLAYSFIFRWIEENSYEISEPPRESYIDGIWNKENEADWLTEIQIPIRKKA
jgi:effector-binding domain-containing protein